MKKILSLLLSATMVIGLAACGTDEPDTPAETPAETPGEAGETLEGTGKGYGGEISVKVTMDGDKIVEVVAEGPDETDGVGTPALEELPAKIVEANSADVDVIAGATVTSKGIIYAVKNAMDPDTNPWPIVKDTDPGNVEGSDVAFGFGVSTLGRKGPGADDKETQVWSFNEVLASVLFDGDGKILRLHVDQVEVATPNYDGDGMPHFSGFPGQGGYNFDSDHDEKVDSVTEDTEENYISEIESWETKRGRGDDYKMGMSTWAEQMDAYEEAFVGKTVDEIEDWFEKYTSDRNGRPLKDGAEDAEDKAKYDALSDEDKAMLADITSEATMSLNDSHGNIVQAIRNAFENREGLEITEAESAGFGATFMPRVGPGKDDKDVQVYSFNQVFAHTMFDADGKIAAIHVDQLEVATPNYDGDGMPHFSGFPGQGGYNFDSDHDEKVDSTTEDTEENFFSEIESWVTKRTRGEDYKMGMSTWQEQMDAYEEFFIGKTVDEIEDWFEKYTSDRNGRPLKDGAEDAEDKAKYDALSDEDKAMLADVTSSATMSLNDSHGNIVAAIRASFENKEVINLKVK
ncbi:MAG TPA: hypothetical protein DHM90_09490 [Clostridiaceae bacterium]|nr:hypothetical protein [Clostridiaceae bacterium]